MSPVTNELFERTPEMGVSRETRLAEAAVGVRMKNYFQDKPDTNMSAIASYNSPGRLLDAEVTAWLERSTKKTGPGGKRIETTITLCTRVEDWSTGKIEHVSIVSTSPSNGFYFVYGQELNTEAERVAAIKNIAESLDLIEQATLQGQIGSTALS